MFKAINTQTNEEIIIIEPRWEQKLDQLREWGREGSLVCQGCKQPVRVRAGKERSWHFAHKQLVDCNYGHESELVLQTRAMLYRWLLSQFTHGVTLEKNLNVEGLPHPVDCWVEYKHLQFAYWIFERGVKSINTREVIRNSLSGVETNWVFVRTMLQEDKERNNYIRLNTTEREFLDRSKYDEIYRDKYSYSQGSLHYLDVDMNQLVTYRALHCIHDPQGFEGYKVVNSMKEIRVSAQNGEFSHPGEYDKLIAYHEEQEREKKEAKTQQSSQNTVYDRSRLSSKVQVPYQKPEGTCVHCGQITRDWTQFDHANQTCLCRECQRKGLSLRNS